MAKNDFNMSFVAAFKQSFNNGESVGGTGSLRFTLPDKRTTGTVALRGGKVEALEITRHPNHILQRLTTNALISAANRDMLLQKFKNNPDSPLVPDFARQYMMLPEQLITDAVKEHFLGVLDEMLTWNAVRVEWKAGADDRVLTMPLVSPEKLIDLGQRRANLLQTIADTYTIEPSQLDGLIFKKLEDVTTDDEDVMMILELGAGEYTPADLYRQCGIIPFNSIRELNQLWLDKVVDLIYAGQFPLSRPDELDQDVVDATAAEAAAEAAVDESTATLNPPAPEPTVQDEAPEQFDDTPAADITAPQPIAAPAVTATTPLMSPFDDDEEIFAADEFDTPEATIPAPATLKVPLTPVDEVAPAADLPETPTSEDQRVAPLAAGVQDFLRAVQTMKEDAQASWDEVTTRDEEIEKVKIIIQEQQEYLNRLVDERTAWNEDFETKRTDYEQTVAYLREHLS